MKLFSAALAVTLLLPLSLSAQGPAASAPSSTQLPPPKMDQSVDFLQEADEILGEMSKLLSLPILKPLKKSLRSREEIKAYLLQKMKEDKDADKRYADRKSMEKFGLLPKDYPLEETLVKVLTEQIAGLYDPDSQEFFIADWNSAADERMVMSHELTHALQDQHFHIEKWADAAKPNDDAELARDAVVEGSALAATLDYQLRGTGSIRDLGEIDASLLLGDVDSSPELAKAPKILQDELLFPYLAGTTFTQRVLKASSGWPEFHKVFEKPPVSTQQIMHPDLYLRGVVPPRISLPDTTGLIAEDWKRLDENGMGEFGTLEILKETLNPERATKIAATWSADRYELFENQVDKRTLLIFRIRLASEAAAASFFGAYGEVLEAKYSERINLLRRPNFFSFDSPGGSIFLRCLGTDCFVLEGGSRLLFDHLTMKMGWPSGPVAPTRLGDPRIGVATLPPSGQDPLRDLLQWHPARSNGFCAAASFSRDC